MPRERIINLTREEYGISSNAVFMIFLVALFVGYKLLEPSGDEGASTKSTSSDPTQSPASNGLDTNDSAYEDQEYSDDDLLNLDSSLFPNPDRPLTALDIVCTAYDINFSDDELSEVELTAGGGRRRAGRSDPPSEIGALKGGTLPKRVRIPGASKNVNWPATEVAATDIEYFTKDAPSTSLYNSNAELEGAKDDWGPNSRGLRPHVASRLTLFEEALLKDGHAVMVDGMKEVEGFMFENWLKPAGSQYPPGKLAEYRIRASEDRWDAQSQWGKLPAVIMDLCLSIVRSKAIDIPALAAAMKREPYIYGSSAFPAKRIIEKGFSLVDALEDGKSGRKVLVKKLVASDEQSAVDLLLGWFALPYRGYLKDQWTSQSAKSGAGVTLPPRVAAEVGTAGSEILKWLSWAGQRYLINRLFTPAGADLLDGSVRVSLSRMLENSDASFKMDVTLFVPSSEELTAGAEAKEGPHWLRSTHDDRNKKWRSLWMRDAVMLCLTSSQQWIAQNFASSNGVLLSDTDRVAIRRLFLRPGYANSLVDRTRGTASAPALITSYIDQRIPRLAQIDLKTFIAASGHVGAMSVGEMIRALRISQIRFLNLRQNNWHTPPEGSCPADQSDARQIAFMLGILWQGLRKWGEQTEHPTYAGDEPELHNTDANRAPGTENIHLDFGGLLPYVEPSDEGPGAGFIWPLQYPRVAAYYIPLMSTNQRVPRLQHPDITSVLGNETYQLGDTATWLLEYQLGVLPAMEQYRDPKNRVLIVVVMRTPQDDVNVLFPALDSVLLDMVRRMIASGQVEEAAIVAAVTETIEVLEDSVKLTTIDHCQTRINAPVLRSLGYTSDSSSMAKEILLKSGLLGSKVGERE